MEMGERPGRQLQRLPARSRFGSMVLIPRDRRRIPLKKRDGIRVHFAEGTIEISTHDGRSEKRFEDLLAIELAPGVTPPRAVK